MPFFSVVIPLYNKAHFINSTLESVLFQSYQDFEIIIVDDGSTDKSVDVVKSLKANRIQLRHQSNKGASAARNYGAHLAEGKWIAFLDADDIWYKDHLEELHKTIVDLPQAEVVSNGYEIQLSSKYIKAPKYSCTFKKESAYIEDYFNSSLIDSLFWTSSVACKKEVFNAVGGFDKDLKTGQDLDLFIRLALNCKLAHNPKITLLYQSNTENNLSKQVNLEEKYKYIRKHRVHEKTNPGLKTYLDINRYSLMLQAKQQNEKQLYNQLNTEIDFRNLSLKQRRLLQLPGWVLKVLKRFQQTLIKWGIYRSAFG